VDKLLLHRVCWCIRHGDIRREYEIDEGKCA
jgi:hypothetical protein